MRRQHPLSVANLIKNIRANEDRCESYCIYGEGDSADATLSSICVLDIYPEITDELEEIYPQFVSERDMEMWFRDELVQDVVANAKHQDPNVTDATILDAIKHYDETDSFLEL